jgi:hypothetical protein
VPGPATRSRGPQAALAFLTRLPGRGAHGACRAGPGWLARAERAPGTGLARPGPERGGDADAPTVSPAAAGGCGAAAVPAVRALGDIRLPPALQPQGAPRVTRRAPPGHARAFGDDGPMAAR